MFVMLIVCILLIFPCPSTGLALEKTEPQLNFVVAQWAYEVRDEGDYDPNFEGAFPRGERAYTYLELEGFSLAEIEGLFYVELAVDVNLRSKRGFKLFSRTNVLELDSWYEQPPATIWFYIYVDIPWWAPRGVYSGEIIVRDQLNQGVLVEEREIRVF